MTKDDNLLVVKDRKLRGHQAGIQCVAISPDGTTVLSGDDEAWLFVWNVKTGEIVQKLSTPFSGAIGAAIWAPRETGSAFILGCADGSIHLYEERQNSRGPFEFVSVVESPGPIECLAFDKGSQKLASVGGGSLQVWKVSDTGTLIPLREEPVQKPVVAKNVIFTDNGASVVVFYLESHEISCYTVEPWDLKWSKIVPTRIGNAHICMADGAFLYISNLFDGVDQYRFPSLEKVQSFTHPIAVNLPLQVASASRGQWIVCGGDSGFARVFSRRTGEMLQLLDHCEKAEAVQVVATHETDEKSLIITGSSSAGQSDLQIWYERTFDPPPLPGAFADSGRSNDANNFLSTAKTIIICVFLALCVMQLITVGLLYLFWPNLKEIIEALLVKSSSSVESGGRNVPTVQIPQIEHTFASQTIQQDIAFGYYDARRMDTEQSNHPNLPASQSPVVPVFTPTLSSTLATKNLNTARTSLEAIRPTNHEECGEFGLTCNEPSANHSRDL